MSKYKLLLCTIAHLRFIQIVYQLKNRIIHSKLKVQKAPLSVTLRYLPCIDRWHCIESNRIFTFLNLHSVFRSWNDTSLGMLWAYNLNYMDWLQQEDMTYENGAEWIDKFIDELSDNLVGLDPYPIALRGINWIKFISEHRGSIDNNRLQRWCNSLYSQYVLLTKKLEYHLLGNHLLEDAYSLFVAAIYFKDDTFYRKSTKLLRQELEEQILPDGAHYEQSPMYHCILLERLLDCCNFSFNNVWFDGQMAFNDFLKDKAILMLGHLESISYQDETIPLLNDSANDIAPMPQMLKMYAQRLGLAWHKIPMKQCGYRKLKNNEMEAIADIGNITASYQPGHTHADTFNYELRIDGRPIVVDTGISTYNKTERRQYERSTAAHNTVSVDGKNSSEVWGGFRVGKRAKVTVLRDDENYLEAMHDGYGCACRRKIELTADSLVIEDIIDTAAISHIHLWKDEDIESVSNGEIITTHCIIRITKDNEIVIKDEKVSTEYNHFHSVKVIDIHFKNRLTYSITKR